MKLSSENNALEVPIDLKSTKVKANVHVPAASNDILNLFLDVTWQCLKDQPEKRPTVEEVMGKLQIALAKQNTMDSSSSPVDDEIFKNNEQGTDQ